jgi:hypothetical protein
MSGEDYLGMDFYKRSGRKAAAILRSMGYSRERYRTNKSGEYMTRWAYPADDGGFRPPVTWNDAPAFDILMIALEKAAA